MLEFDIELRKYHFSANVLPNMKRYEIVDLHKIHD
jgi:hypothetical protein